MNAINTNHPGGRSTSLVAVLSLLGFVLAAAGALLHATTTYIPFPSWDLDPLIFPLPHTGLGPGRSMLVDLVIQFGCVLVLLGEWLAGRRVDWRALLLLLIGAGVMWYGGRRDEPDGVSASAWIAAISVGVTMVHVCRSPRLRRTVLAIGFAFVCLLALRGAQQVFIEHPETMRSFNQGKAQVFASQGWDPESTMARTYARRVSQSDATGWFGLSNVYATFAAGGAAGAVAMLVYPLLMRRRTRREERIDGAGVNDPSSHTSLAKGRLPIVVGIGLLGIGMGTLSLSQAKGGFAALFVGVVFLLGVMLASRSVVRIGPGIRGAIGAALAVGAMLAVFVLIIGAGLIGERSELSLLFRWYYMEAAAKIGLLEFSGCGPGGFQPLYSLHKNPLSPEDVSSAHNLLMDYWASGGVLSLTWIGLWLWIVARTGTSAVANPQPVAVTADRSKPIVTEPGFRWEHIEAAWCVRVAIAVGLIAALIGMQLEQPITTLDLAAVRLLGLLASGLVAWYVLMTLPRRVGEYHTDRVCRLALSGGAIAMSSHALIDQTGVWPGSASLLMLFIGAAAAGEYDTTLSPSTRLNHRVPRMASLMGILLLVPLAVVASRPSSRERLLVSAAKAVAPLAGFHQRFNEIMVGGSTPVRQAAGLNELAGEVSEALSGVIQPTPEAVQQALIVLERRRLEQATDRLLAAARVGVAGSGDAASGVPRDFKSLREASRLQAILGHRALERRDIPDAIRRFDLAIDFSRLRLSYAPAPTRRRATEYGWLGLAHQSKYDALAAFGRADMADLRAAADANEAGALLDPYNLEFGKRLMGLYAAIGDMPTAARWARRTLELDTFKRLDRETQGLSEAERKEAERLAGAS